jgi:hypothetical protein
MGMSSLVRLSHAPAKRGLSLLALGVAALEIVGATAFFGAASTSERMTQMRTESTAAG